MGRSNVKRAAFATVLAVLSAVASVRANEQLWMWQYELGFGREQIISSFHLGMYSGSAVTAFHSHTNGTTRFRLPLYSSDPTAWSLLRVGVNGDKDTGGSSVVGMVLVGALLAWQTYEAGSAEGDRAVEEALKDIEFNIPDLELRETESGGS